MDCLISNAFLRYQTECPVCLVSVLFLLHETKSDASAHFTSLNLMSIFHALLKYFIVFLSLMFFWSVHAFLSPSLHFLIIDLMSSALLGYPAVCSLLMAQWESAQAAPVLLTLSGTHGCSSTLRICRESDKTNKM